MWFLELGKHGLCDCAEGFHLICGEDIADVASYCLFVVVSGFGGELSPGLGYADDGSSVVFDAVLSSDEPARFHASELVGEPALFPLQSAAQRKRSYRLIWRFGERNQDLEVGF